MELTTIKLNLEMLLQSKEMRLRLGNMSLEYGLYSTEADIAVLQQYFPTVNLRKLYEVEQYHRKLAKILDEQFKSEQNAIKDEIDIIKAQLEIVNAQIKKLGFVGNISKEFLDKHSAITGEINALRTQNQAFLKQKELQEEKANADEVSRRSIEDVLRGIEVTLNDKMKEFNESLFSTQCKLPYMHFNRYDSYKFETPMDTGIGSNYKEKIVYDLAMLFSTALLALAHDSLLFKNLEKNVEDGIIKIYNSTKKQVFIAYDKQDDCRSETRNILEENCVLRISNDNCELYGGSWNIEE